MADTVEIKLRVDAKGAVQSIETTGGAVIALGSDVDRLGKKTKSFGDIVNTAIGNIAANAIGRLSSALSNAAGDFLRVGASAEQALADLSAITGIAGDDLKRLGDTAVREAMRTGVAAEQQIEAYKLLASNIDIATIGGVSGLERLGTEVVTLTQAAGVDLAEAANIVAGSINSFGLEAKEGARVVNVLAAGSKFGAAEVSDLGASLKNAGATAAGANLSFEETVGAAEVLSQNFVKGGEAGTGLRNVISILQTESKKLADAGIKGVNIESEGLSKSLSRLTPLLDDAGALSEIFGRENQSVARILISNAAAVDEMTQRVTDTNTAQEQAAIQTATFNGAVSRLIATIEGVGIGLFQEYQEELTGIVEGTINVIRYLVANKDALIETAKYLGIAVSAIAAYNAVVQAQTIVSKAATIAQRILNVAMKANPIGLVVAGLTLLVGLLIKFRDRVADAAAVFIDFGISVLTSLKNLGETLGLEFVSNGIGTVIGKLETVSDRLRQYAEDTRAAKGETDELGGSFGGAGAGIEYNTDKLDDNTRALDENTAAKERNRKPPPPRLGIEVKKEEDILLGPTTENAQLDELASLVQTFEPLEIVSADSINSVSELIKLFKNLRDSATFDDVRKDHQKTIESLETLRDVMTGAAEETAAAKERERQASEAALASRLASVQVEKNAGASAVAAAKSQALQIINAEIGKAVAKAIATIPFPANLILGAAAAAGIKSLIGGLVGFAAGGIVGGFGGTDSQIIRATPGEFVVNPTATRQNREVIESINSGGRMTLSGRLDISGRLTMERDRLVAGIDEQQLVTFETRGDV